VGAPADERLAGSGPDDIGIGRRYSERTDRGDRLIIENGNPLLPAVAGLPDAAGRRARIVDERITRHAGDGDHPVSFGTDVAPRELAVQPADVCATAFLRVADRKSTRLNSSH